MSDSLLSYVLITPARNEEAFIERTIQSVVKQTVLPMRWIIANDGSTDHTREIISRYLNENLWITLIDLPARKDRHFAAKVHAFNEALRNLQDLDFALIGNLDADISFGPDHFEFLISKMAGNRRLGVIGTAYTQEGGWNSTQDSFEGETSVHGACQLFRRQCFADIGGYCANRAGGIDWIAVTTARMRGWETRNYRDRYFHHYRTMGTAKRGQLGAMYDYGKKDYFLGGSPVWELLRVVFRMTRKPFVFGGLALGAGYSVAALCRVDRPVSPELMRFHREEQSKKLRMIFSSLIRSGKLQTYLPEIGKEPRSTP
jgi:glycosyltransferase involved in cell wall biosynthesis